VRRVVEALPWPLAVIPPFLATVGLPLLALALVFGVAGSRTHVRQTELRLSGRVEVHGMHAVSTDRAAVDFGELAGHERAEASVYVTNANQEPAWVVVTAAGIPPGCSLVEYPREAVRVDPGQTEELHFEVMRETEAVAGDFQFRLILLASAHE
jgi:hypothetical protein